MLSILPLEEGSESLPLVTTGDACLLGKLAGPGFSVFPFTVTATPGLDLPAEIGRSGKVVRKFGGVSSGKSGRTMGCGDCRNRGLGELGRDVEAPLRALGRERPTEEETPDAGDKEGAEFLRVGVDGRDVERAAGELKFAGICGLELGVEGLEFCDGLTLSAEDVLGLERALEGVEDLDNVGRADGVEGLAVDEERLVGVDGLM